MGRAGLLDVLLVVGKGFTVEGDMFVAGACRGLSCRGGTNRVAGKVGALCGWYVTDVL